MTEDAFIFQRCDIILAKIPQEEESIPVFHLPADIINQSRTFNIKRRLQFLTGRALLARWLYQTLDIQQLPTITTVNNGRPSFCDPDLPDFNITHSGNCIMLAINQEGQAGIDLELNRPRQKFLTLAQHCFSDLEYQWLNQCPEPEQIERFWQLWTLRESLLKHAGLGVWQMKSIAIDPYQHKIFANNIMGLTSFTYQHNDLFWTLTTNSISNEEQIMFWQASADLLQFQLQYFSEPVIFQSNE